jgi:hypothetical protein
VRQVHSSGLFCVLALVLVLVWVRAHRGLVPPQTVSF